MRARRPIKIVAWTLASLVAVPVVLLLLAWGAANTETGRAWITDALAGVLSAPGAPAEVVGLEGPIPQDMRLKRLVLRDGDGAWLTVEGAQLSWSPGALLTGRLDVAAVRADRVVLARVPESGKAPPEPGPTPQPAFEIPELPVAVRIDTLAISRLDLGAPVLDVPAAFRIDGQAAAPVDGTLRSNLSVVRIDGPEERFTAEAAYARGTRTLDLDATLDAAQGGLVAQLLDLPDADASTLRLHGSGPVDAWTGRLDGRFGADVSIGADLRLTGARRLDATGEAKVAALLDGQTAALLGGPVAFDLAVQRTGDAGLEVVKGALRTPTAELDLSGGLSDDGGTLDARAELRVREPAPFNALAAPAAFDGLTARVHAQGPIQAPKLNLQAEIAQLRAPDVTLRTVDLSADYTPDDALALGDLSIQVEAARGDFDMPELAGYSGHPLSLALDGRLDLEALRLSRARAEIEAKDLSIALDGGGALDGSAGDAAFTANFADLARLDPLLQLGLVGRGTLTGHAAVGGADTLVRGTLAGDLNGIGLDEPILQALLHDRLEFASDLTVAPDGALSLANLSVTNPEARIRGDLSFPADFASLDGRFDASVPRAEVLSQALGVDLAGAARASAHLHGPTADPGVETNLEIADAAIAGQKLGRLAVEADTRTLASGARGRLDVSASESPVGAIDAGTDFALEESAFTLAGLRAEAPGIAVREGRLSVPLGGGALEGRAVIDAEDLGAPLERMAGLPASGSGELVLELGPGAEGQGATLTGTLDALTLSDEAVTVDSVRLSADLDRAFDSPTGRISLDLTKATAGPATFETLSVKTDGGLSDLQVKLRGEGELFGPMTLAADAGLVLDAPVREARLSRFRLDIGERRLRLAHETVLRQGDDLLEIADLVLEAGDGRLTLDGRQDRDTVKLALDVSDLPLAYSRIVLQEPKLSGRLDATVRLDGPLGGLSGALDITVKDLGSDGTDLSPMTATLTSTLRDGVYKAEGEVAGPTETPVTLSGQVPLQLSLAGMTAEIPQDGRVQGKLAWTGDVAPLMPLVPVSGHRLTGQADLDFELSGRVSDPNMTGRLVLDDGQYENLETGTLLTEIALTIEATGERVELTRFQAKDGGDGILNLTGGVDLAPEKGFPMDLQVEASSAKLVRLDYLVADADADLELTGPLNDLLLAGTITMRRVEARIPESLPPEVAQLEVVTEEELKAQEAAAADGRASPEEPASRMRLDLTVDMPGQVFVRGNSLDSEWHGNLKVTGTAAKPIVDGEIRVQRGRLTLLGKAFELEQGLIAFDDERQIDPTVNITAVSTNTDITAIVKVTGRASNPSISLDSKPPLPQDEVLARLLFGKSAGKLSPVEGAQLAAAVAQLSIGGGGPGVMDRLRNLVGVDVLQVGGGGEDTGPTVEAGKYVSDDVFLGVEQGATADSSKVKVEVEVTDNIFLESDVGVSGGSNIGVQFKWDY